MIWFGNRNAKMKEVLDSLLACVCEEAMRLKGMPLDETMPNSIYTYRERMRRLDEAARKAAEVLR